jgi:drug/metabolite transporter (DMT)-like permease
MLSVIILAIITVLTMLSCCITFSKTWHDKWYYIPCGLALTVIINFIWYSSAKFLGDEKKIYLFSLYWDFIVCSIYLFFPLLLINAKIDKWQYLGIFLMFLGIIIIKIKS